MPPLKARAGRKSDSDSPHKNQASLDAASADEVLEIMAALNRDHGKTIVMVTHDPHAARYAKASRYLDKGVLVPAGQNLENRITMSAPLASQLAATHRDA